MHNSSNTGRLAERRLTVDDEARFLGMLPDEVREFVLYEAAITGAPRLSGRATICTSSRTPRKP